MKKILGVLLGTILGAMGMWFYTTQSIQTKATEQRIQSAEPLYWVAPMDDSYRRDKPGKSPMGMDLVPVYGEEQSDQHVETGVVFVPPHIINNLSVSSTQAIVSQQSATSTAPGHVLWNKDKLTHVHPRVAGWLENLRVKSNGDPIKKGQPLYDIYAPDLVNVQEELLLALKSGNQRLVRASKNRLAAFNVSDKAIEDIQSSGQTRQYVTYYAPQSGYVDDLAVQAGHYVQPGQQMMAIGQLQDIWVMVDVLNRQVNSLSLGADVELRFDAMPGVVFHSNIDYIYPTVNPATRTLQFRVTLPNESGLIKPGMYAEISVLNPETDRVLTVPKQAVIQTGNQNRVVMALGDGSFKSIEVRTGRNFDQAVEIISGLMPGDEVVTSGQFLLDSESSKTSDFNRYDAIDNHEDMNHEDMNHEDMNHEDMNHD